MNTIDKFIKHYFGDVKTASPKYYKKLVEEINSVRTAEREKCAEKLRKTKITIKNLKKKVEALQEDIDLAYPMTDSDFGRQI